MSMLGSLKVAAMTAHNNVLRADHEVTTSIQRLSSGYRINSIKDDAAGAAVGSRISLELAALRAVTQNVSFGSSAVQIAEQGLSVIQDSLTRLKVLAVQASSGNYSDVERAMLDTEFQNIMTGIDNMARDTKFGNISLLETGIEPIIFDSSFDDGTLPDETYLRGSASVALLDGAIRLMDGADGNAEGIFASDQAFLTDSGLTVDFTVTTRGNIDETSTLYGGGFSFFLVDSTQYDASSTAHPTGGSSNLGYRGLTGGFVGIGFDSFGAYSSGDGGPGNVQQGIAVRGSDSMGFSYIDGIDATPYGGVDGTDEDPNTGGESVLTRSISLSLDEDFILNVDVTFEETGTTVSVVSDFDLGAAITGRPDSVKFGFAASIVGRRNNFQIQDLDVTAQTDVVTRMDAAALALRSHAGNSIDDQLAIPRFDATLDGLALNNSVHIGTQSAAERAIKRVDFALDQVIEARTYLGATQANFKSVVSRHLMHGENLEKARSTIMDADIAATTVDLINDQTWRGTAINSLVESETFRRRTASALRAAQESFETVVE